MATKIIRKWFWVWEFEKEEAWLNDMAKQGWALDGIGFCKYRFMSCEPGEYTVRLEMMEDMPATEKGMEYINFVEDTGAKCIGSYMKWVYFRRKTADGAFDLFSDIDSRIKHLDRIVKLILIIMLLNLSIGIMQIENLGGINLACAALLGYCWYRLDQKKKRLSEDRVWRE